VSHICIVYRQLLETRHLSAVPTFYDEMGIGAPEPGEGGDRVPAQAWAKLQGRLQRHYAGKPLPWLVAPTAYLKGPRRGSQGAGGAGGAGVGGSGDGCPSLEAVEQFLVKQQQEARKRLGGNAEDEEQRGLSSWYLMYEILADEGRRQVYDDYFMPTLTKLSGDSAGFLRETCLWDA
jgi:hypothetical protein